MRRPRRAEGLRLIILCACAAALHGSAQTVYKSVDSTGKVTYGDAPPAADSKQKVTPIAAPGETNVMKSTVVPNGKDSFDVKVADRRRLRDALQAEIDAARQAVKDAEAALAGGQAIGDDERQWTASFPDPGAKPDKDGRIPGRGGKVLCTTGVAADGSPRAFCPPWPVPNEAYRTRIAGLEAAIETAKANLAAAIESYRRNSPD